MLGTDFYLNGGRHCEEVCPSFASELFPENSHFNFSHDILKQYDMGSLIADPVPGVFTKLLYPTPIIFILRHVPSFNEGTCNFDVHLPHLDSYGGVLENMMFSYHNISDYRVHYCSVGKINEISKEYINQTINVFGRNLYWILDSCGAYEHIKEFLRSSTINKYNWSLSITSFKCFVLGFRQEEKIEAKKLAYKIASPLLDLHLTRFVNYTRDFFILDEDDQQTTKRDVPLSNTASTIQNPTFMVLLSNNIFTPNTAIGRLVDTLNLFNPMVHTTILTFYGTQRLLNQIMLKFQT